jgi:DNA-binding CsgD family transcriptional regulator
MRGSSVKRRGSSFEREFFEAFFHRSREGCWRVELTRPLSVRFSVRKQRGHIRRNAYLAQCNKSYAELCGVSHPEAIVGVRLPAVFRDKSLLMQFIEGGYQIADRELVEVDKRGRVRTFVVTAVGIIRRRKLVRVWGVERLVLTGALEFDSLGSLSERLTERQRVILELTLRGMSLKEIGKALQVSPSTVETIRKRVMKKIGAQNTVELIRWVLQNSVVNSSHTSAGHGR